MTSVRIEYYSDHGGATADLVSDLNNVLPPDIIVEQFDRQANDWRFVDELGGDDVLPDYIHLVLIFLSANVLAEFVKTFAGRVGSILAEKLFARIEQGKKKPRFHVHESKGEHTSTEQLEGKEYEMMYSFYCHIEQENKTRHSVFSYRAKSYGNLEHGQVDSPERMKQVLIDELDKLAKGLGSDRWDL